MRLQTLSGSARLAALQLHCAFDRWVYSDIDGGCIHRLNQATADVVSVQVSWAWCLQMPYMYTMPWLQLLDVCACELHAVQGCVHCKANGHCLSTAVAYRLSVLKPAASSSCQALDTASSCLQCSASPGLMLEMQCVTRRD